MRDWLPVSYLAVAMIEALTGLVMRDWTLMGFGVVVGGIAIGTAT